MKPGGDLSSKSHRRGTHRHISPADTLRAVEPLLPHAGITRVANITGLDRVGIPVVAVYRPNSRSLAVFQGKGLDLDAARASGVMEAIEAYHAEHVTHPLRLASWTEMRRAAPVVDVELLPRLSVSTLSSAQADAVDRGPRRFERRPALAAVRDRPHKLLAAAPDRQRIVRHELERARLWQSST